jgi:hypothetical protein
MTLASSISWSVVVVLLFLQFVSGVNSSASTSPNSWFSRTLAQRGGGHEDASNNNNNNNAFEILEEKVVYSGWRTVTQRTVQMRNGKVADFDVSLRYSTTRYFTFFHFDNTNHDVCLQNVYRNSWWVSKRVEAPS